MPYQAAGLGDIMAGKNKRERQILLASRLRDKPFMTDEELAKMLAVSVQTVRLDRMELGIPELRERVRRLAEDTSEGHDDDSGRIIDLTPGISGISVMEITPAMTFDGTKVARARYMFAQACDLAEAVAAIPSAVTGVAYIKYKTPVHVGDRLVARAKLMHQRENRHFVWVMTKRDMKEVFRAKFFLEP